MRLTLALALAIALLACSASVAIDVQTVMRGGKANPLVAWYRA